MISIIITSFKEPQTIGKAIESFTSQKIKQPYEIIVAAPDEETLNVVRKYSKKNKKIKIFKDPGKGKSYALNLLLPKIKGEIIILSDGDVYVSRNSVDELLKPFRDKNVGCVSGRPVSSENKKNIYGYWSHLLCYSAHVWRFIRSRDDKFLECSGYLWAFRNKIIKKFPLDVGEDTIVPMMFFLRRWKIKYVDKAEVYVKYPLNLREFLKQKKRTAGAHDNIGKYIDPKKIPRMKTFFNEIAGGLIPFTYTKTLKEFLWTTLLYPFRLYIWLHLFFDSYILKRKYSDGWDRIEGTK